MSQIPMEHRIHFQRIHIQTAAQLIKFKMDLDPERYTTERDILQFCQAGQCCEPEVVHAMLRAVRPGDFVIDVGANVGFFTLLLAKLVGSTGKVLAVEADQDNATRLSNNLRANDINHVTLVRQPLWKCETEIEFHYNADSNGGHALWSPTKWHGNELSRERPRSEMLKTTTLDTLVRPTESPRLIKIDTEGAEQDILDGAGRLLNNRHPEFIIVEFNPFGLQQLGHSGDTLRKIMRAYGYQLFLLAQDGGLPACVPDGTTITHAWGCAVLNVMFSTFEAVAFAWPRVPYE